MEGLSEFRLLKIATPVLAIRVSEAKEDKQGVI
jgi:hypothetical protein